MRRVDGVASVAPMVPRAYERPRRSEDARERRPREARHAIKLLMSRFKFDGRRVEHHQSMNHTQQLSINQVCTFEDDKTEKRFSRHLQKRRVSHRIKRIQPERQMRVGPVLKCEIENYFTVSAYRANVNAPRGVPSPRARSDRKFHLQDAP